VACHAAAGGAASPWAAVLAAVAAAGAPGRRACVSEGGSAAAGTCSSSAATLYTAPGSPGLAADTCRWAASTATGMNGGTGRRLKVDATAGSSGPPWRCERSRDMMLEESGRQKNRVTFTPAGGERALPGPKARLMREPGRDTTVAVHPQELCKRESLNGAQQPTIAAAYQGALLGCLWRATSAQLEAKAACRSRNALQLCR
jgi:hypothetical protein